MLSFFRKVRIVTLLLLSLPAAAQRITYAAPGGNTASGTDFQIIGKCGGNLLVYMNLGHYDPVIAVFDRFMQLKAEEPMKFLPGRPQNIDFIAYPATALLFYQVYRKRKIGYYAAALGSNGRLAGPPLLIDETEAHPSDAYLDNYTMLCSEDKQKILVFTIRKQPGDPCLHFFTFLLDKELHILRKKESVLPAADPLEKPFGFQLSDSGRLAFGVFKRDADDGSFITGGGLVVSDLQQDTMHILPLSLSGTYLDTLPQLKMDCRHHKLYMAGFYYGVKKRDIAGLFLCSMALDSASLDARLLPYDQSVREKMRGSGATLEEALDNYRLRDIILESSGGIVLAAESVSHDPVTGDAYNNIAAIAYDPDDSLRWCSVIPEGQSGDLGYDFSSFHLINTGRQLHFLFNGKNAGDYTFSNYIYLISDYSLSHEGKTERLPLMRDIERKYHLMPRYARQTGAGEVIVPFEQGSVLSFARIDY